MAKLIKNEALAQDKALQKHGQAIQENTVKAKPIEIQPIQADDDN